MINKFKTEAIPLNDIIFSLQMHTPWDKPQAYLSEFMAEDLNHCVTQLQQLLKRVNLQTFLAPISLFI